MPSRLGPRFAIEAIFLVLVAVGVAFADLSAQWIVIVMAGAWLLTAVVEWIASRPPRPARPVAAAPSWPEADVHAVAPPPHGQVAEVAETGAGRWPSDAFPPLPVVEEAEPSAPVEPGEPPQPEAPEPSVAAGEAEAPDAEVELEPAPLAVPAAEASAAAALPEAELEPVADVAEDALPVPDTAAAPEEPARPKRRFWHRDREEPESGAAAVEAEAPDAEVELEPAPPAGSGASAEGGRELESVAEVADEESPVAETVAAKEELAEPRRRFWRRRREVAAVVGDEPASEPAEPDLAAVPAAPGVDEVVPEPPEEAAAHDEPPVAESREAEVRPDFSDAAAVAAAASVVDEVVPERSEEAAAHEEPPAAGSGEVEVPERPRRRFWRAGEGETALATEASSRTTEHDAESEDETAAADEAVAVQEPEPVAVARQAPAEQEQEEPADEDVEAGDAGPIVVEPPAPDAADADVEERGEERPARHGRFWRRNAEPEGAKTDAAAEPEAAPVPAADDDAAIETVGSQAVEEVEDEPETRTRKRFWRRQSEADAVAAVDEGAAEDAAAEPEAATAEVEEPPVEAELPDGEPAFVKGDASGALGEVKRSDVYTAESEPEPEGDVQREQLKDFEPEAQQEAAVAPPRLMRRLPQPREWTIWELERAIGAHAGDDPQRDRQWRMTLFDLRRHADRRGAIPVELDPLVRETFADLIEPAGGS